MSLLAQRLRGRSELGVALLLGAFGVLVLWDAAHIPVNLNQRGPVGSGTVPVLIGVVLLVCAVALAVDVLRGGSGEAEGGEDIDLSHPSDWRTVMLLVAAFLTNVVLIERVGWPISGTVLFWGCVYALGSRHYVRDAIVAALLAVGTYFVFARGLGIDLPAGVLEGIL